MVLVYNRLCAAQVAMNFLHSLERRNLCQIYVFLLRQATPPLFLTLFNNYEYDLTFVGHVNHQGPWPIVSCGPWWGSTCRRLVVLLLHDLDGGCGVIGVGGDDEGQAVGLIHLLTGHVEVAHAGNLLAVSHLVDAGRGGIVDVSDR